MEQENIRKETFLATLLLLAGTLILWKGYSYEPDSRQFPVFLGWLFVSFSILNAITLFKKFKPLIMLIIRHNCLPTGILER